MEQAPKRLREDDGETIEKDEKKKEDSLVLLFDGGSRGNPGNAGSGWILTKMENPREDARTSPLFSAGWHWVGDNETNNQAEYSGLIEGLEAAIWYVECFNRLVIKGDSMLVIKQMRGEYRVKSEKMLPLHRRANVVVRKLKAANPKLVVEFMHVPRAFNDGADALADHAIDTKKSGTVSKAGEVCSHAGVKRVLS